jgi:hypothetical protein
LSSLLDVPAQLALVLSLAAASTASEPPRVPSAAPLNPPAAVRFAEPLAGPYRFGEGNWLRALKDDLPQNAHGYAQSIFRTSGGRYYVPRETERQQILEARDDSELAARAARAFARSNARSLRASLQRPPTAGELYIAHLFGPEAAASLIARVRARPNERVAKQFPELAAALQDLAGPRASGSLTLAQLYARLTAPFERSPQEAGRSAPDAQPTIADMLQHGAAWGALRAHTIAWQTEVSAGGGAPAPQ